MQDLLSRLWDNVVDRVTGPLAFRIVIQPLVASYLAIRAGLQDALEGRPAYGWAVFTDSRYRSELLRDGWKDIAKVFVLAVIIDCIYEFIVARQIYVGEALVVAVILAIVPYLLIRGPTNRLAQRQHRRDKPLV